jgi:hypothetical protein
MSPTEKPLDVAEAKRLGGNRGTLYIEGMGRSLNITPWFQRSVCATLFIDTTIVAQIHVEKGSRPQVFRAYLLYQGATIHLADGEAPLVEAYLNAFYGDAS